MKTTYIGIDPDLRLLNAAMINDYTNQTFVFARKNKKGGVVEAARCACRLVEDVIACITGEADFACTDRIVTIVEDQSMQHTRLARQKGRNINYESIKTLAQVSGCLMGAFSNLSMQMVLVPPVTWKGNVPKNVAHKRYYTHLQIKSGPEKRVKNLYPAEEYKSQIEVWSEEKINPGDYADINDSLGLALYGRKKSPA